MFRHVVTKNIRRREPLKFVSRSKYSEKQPEPEWKAEWTPSKGGIIATAVLTLLAAYGFGWLSLKAFKPELPGEDKK